ncbi:MAG: hypothetical protein ACRDVK_11535 [Acidimicrobiia bacterium]
MWQQLRHHVGLLGFIGAYYVGFLILGVVNRNEQVVFYAGFIALAFLGLLYWDSRRRFSQLVLWGLALWGAMHMAGGMIPIDGARVLYNVQLLPFLRFDQLVHAIGFGFAGLAFWESVGQQPGSGALMVLMGGLGFGALNEMIEFLITRFVPDTNIGGFENTGWDLVANTTGATIAAMWVHWRWSIWRTHADRPG